MKVEKYAKPRQVKKNERPKDWYIENKYDGTRIFLIQTEESTKLVNKRGRDKTRHYPDITQEVNLPEGVILDGEMIVQTEEKPHGDKNKLQRRDGGKPVLRKSGEKNFEQKLKMKQYPATYVAFDILRSSEKNMRTCEIEKRREKLEEITESLNDCVMRSKRFTSFEDAWATVTENQLEGVILKKPESEYPTEGRTSKWRKVKNIKDVERVITGYEEHSKGVTVETESGDRVTVNGRQAKQVKKLVDNKGNVRCEVSCLEETENGSLREPTWKRLIKEEL